MMKRMLITALCLVAFTGLITACGGGDTETAPDAAAPDDGAVTTIDAEGVFKQNCVSCHGADLKGVLPGRTNLQKVGAELTHDDIAATIADGRNAMPAFKGNLSDEEIVALADWLAAKK